MSVVSNMKPFSPFLHTITQLAPGNLRTRLGEAEDIVHEKQHILKGWNFLSSTYCSPGYFM